MIYLDNAATSLQKPPCVAQAVCRALGSFASSARGAYGSSLDASRTVYAAREQLAQLFEFDRPERICFTQNATEALNIAAMGLFSKGDHILATDCEHNSVLRPLYRLQNAGTAVDFVRADRMGRLKISDFAAQIRPNTRAIFCAHASNVTGNCFDLEALAALAHKNNALLIADVSQTAGELPVSVKKTGVDILCFTGHKGLMGPQGTGGILVGEQVSLRPLLVGGTGVQSASPTQPEQYPAHLEAGTLNAHGIAGLLAAVGYIHSLGIAAIAQQEAALTRRFYAGVRALPGVTVYGDFSAAQRAPIVSLNLAGYDASALADLLYTRYDICVRAGLHCAPRMHEALGTKQQGAVRFSFGHYTTERDVDAAIAALREISAQ